MDPLDTWRDVLERILTEHAAIPYANGDVQTAAVFDRERDRYLLIDLGWKGGQRVHGALVHVDIVEGRFWIQHDGTENGVANDLVDAGVPRDRIVLAFHPPALRGLTGFAA